ncbi:Pterocarpan synthase 1 [Linum grandiflorum]
MAKLITNLLHLTPLILLLTTTTTAATFSKKTSKRPTREKQTHLHFYFHDIITSTTPTAYPLNHNAVPGIVNSSTLFGVMVMADDPLTAGPELNSTLVGRAQGMYGSAALTDFVLEMVYTLAFTHGAYNGSTLTLMGPIHPRSIVNELSITGGTGLFRFARGYVVAKRIVLDFQALLVVRELDIYVSHY